MNTIRDITTLRLELGIHAQQLISQVRIENRNLEEALTQGLQKGLNELLTEEGFEAMVAQEVKEQVRQTIRQAAQAYSLKHKIHEMIFNQLDQKIAEVAAGWGDKLLAQLEPQKTAKKPTAKARK